MQRGRLESRRDEVELDVNEEDFDGAIERVIAGLERKSRVLAPDEKEDGGLPRGGSRCLWLVLGARRSAVEGVIIPRGVGALGYAQVGFK